MDESILDVLDGAAHDRVLVYGSLPPAGRDLDLLVREPERRVFEYALEDAGYLQHGCVWVRFADGGATAVDLTPAVTWGLAAEELAALYSDAVLLDGRAHIACPSGHHALLILARRAQRRPLGERQRRRLADADADAWAEARRRAAQWGVTEQLDALARGDAPTPSRARAVAHGVRVAARGNVICLSGLDGAGKSSQAALLRDALHVVGIDAKVEWRPFGQNPTLGRVSRLGRHVLAALRRFSASDAEDARAASDEPLLAKPGDATQRSAAGRAALFAWTTFVALANALHQRRTAAENALQGKFVIFDRYSLDSVVRLRYAYGDAERFRFQSFLIRALSPKPRCAFFLDVPAETALGRKVDQWSLEDLRRQAELYREEAARQGVRRLDGERPREELAADIATEVWRALR
jgi:thymidylate kinase